jgi:hypothetical protein
MKAFLILILTSAILAGCATVETNRTENDEGEFPRRHIFERASRYDRYQ